MGQALEMCVSCENKRGCDLCTDLHEWIMEHLEMECDLKAYKDAEQEGRLVVLPCKVGDWVYALWNVPTEYRYVIYCAEVKEICHSVRNCRPTTTYRLEPIEYRGRRKEYRDDDFGKTVFLTREEAEAAMEAQKGGDV